MRVVFRADVFHNQTAWSDLDRIVCRTDEGAHEWEIDDPDAIEESDWLRGSRSNIREVYEKATIRSSYPFSNCLHARRVIVSGHAGSDHLPPALALAYLSGPLFVLGENKFSDGLLLSTILTLLAPEPLRSLYKRKINNFIEPDHGGGIGELIKHVEWRIQEAADKGVPVRLVVFSDSDGRWPGHRSDDAERVERECARLSIPCLILSKRNIESYISDEVLIAWEALNRNRRLQVEAIQRLSPKQRDHYYLKSGFSDKALKPEEERLYAGVSEADMVSLKQGLGDIIFSLRDHAEAISAEGLRQRDWNGDLDRLVEMIMKEV